MLRKLTFCFAILLSGLTYHAQAQIEAKLANRLQSQKMIYVSKSMMSSQHMSQVKTLLAGVDPSLYRIKVGNEIIGNKALNLGDVRQGGKKVRPGEAQGFAVVFHNDDLIYIYSDNKGKFESALGKEKLVQLQRIMQQYQ